MIYTDNIHLVASTVEELHSFANKIGLKRCWFAGLQKGHPHYDLINKKKKPLTNKEGITFQYLAIVNGAGLVTDRDIVNFFKEINKVKECNHVRSMDGGCKKMWRSFLVNFNE